MTIDLHTIDVQSLGEPAAATEAQMRFKLEVWDYDGNQWAALQTFEFDNNNATLLPIPVRNYVADPVVVIGPRRIGKQLPGLVLNVNEFDAFPFANEHASSRVYERPQAIRVTPGEDYENQPLNISVRAAQPDDPFDPEQAVVVDLNVTVTVDHI